MLTSFLLDLLVNIIGGLIVAYIIHRINKKKKDRHPDK